MHDVLNLDFTTSLGGVNVSQLKIKPLMADTLLKAMQFKTNTADYEKTLILSVFTELREDDFKNIHAQDYLRMRAVTESFTKPSSKQVGFTANS